MKDEDKVHLHLASTTVQTMNYIAKTLLQLLIDPTLRGDCFSILINLTYCSMNTTIYICDVIQALPYIVSFISESPQDVFWLLNHLVLDSKPDLPEGLID